MTNKKWRYTPIRTPYGYVYDVYDEKGRLMDCVDSEKKAKNAIVEKKIRTREEIEAEVEAFFA